MINNIFLIHWTLPVSGTPSYLYGSNSLRLLPHSINKLVCIISHQKRPKCVLKNKNKNIKKKNNLTQADSVNKYYTSVIYGSIRMQQEVDAVLINSIVYIHTFIQIAFLWPVLKPLTCLTNINKCQLLYVAYLIKRFIQNELPEKFVYLWKFLYVLLNYALYSCFTFCIMSINILSKLPKKLKYLWLINVKYRYFYASIQVHIVHFMIMIKVKEIIFRCYLTLILFPTWLKICLSLCFKYKPWLYNTTYY